MRLIKLIVGEQDTMEKWPAPFDQLAHLPQPVLELLRRMLAKSLKPDKAGAYIPGFDRLLATDRMKIGGTYLTNRVLVHGIGAPFVSAGVRRNEAWEPDKHYYSV